MGDYSPSLECWSFSCFESFWPAVQYEKRQMWQVYCQRAQLGPRIEGDHEWSANLDLTGSSSKCTSCIKTDAIPLSKASLWPEVGPWKSLWIPASFLLNLRRHFAVREHAGASLCSSPNGYQSHVSVHHAWSLPHSFGKTLCDDSSVIATLATLLKSIFIKTDVSYSVLLQVTHLYIHACC